jgi:hypothetical protein
MNGWIKLHAQVLDNDVWRNDRTAWHVFEYLLLKAYAGKPQGVVVTSRYQIADMVGGNNNTIYKALKRLEKAKMVTSVATSKKTTIRICNWNSFQGNGNQSSNNKVTTKQQQSNTLNKNVDIRNITTLYGKPELNEMFNYWQTKTGLPITAQAQANRRACSNLFNKYGAERLQRLIEGVALAQGDQYAPRIANFVQLQSKVDDLILWGKQKSTKKGTIKI